MNEIFDRTLNSHEQVLSQTRALKPLVEQAVNLLIGCYQRGGKILLAGNGGSAADAQHIAGEFVGRFLKERTALPAIALNTNSTIITAIGNDYSFENVFSRQVESFGTSGDVLIAISTSGTSRNVVEAARVAKDKGLIVIGMTGQAGGPIGDLSDVCLCVPSPETPRVQEMHIMLAHIMCEATEAALC